jgi:hypothetical protein
VVDDDPTTFVGDKWSIRNGLLYWSVGVDGKADRPTKIIEINENQLVQQEISGPYKGAVEVMWAELPPYNP